MHILVIVAETTQRFLIKLDEEEHIEEIKHLVRSRKRKKAIAHALSKGRVTNLGMDDSFVTTDLILTKDGAYWEHRE
jgi:hypothetical protein